MSIEGHTAPLCNARCDDWQFELSFSTDVHPEATGIAWGWSTWEDALRYAVESLLGQPIAIAAILAELSHICWDGDGMSDDDAVITSGHVHRVKPSCEHTNDEEIHSYTYRFRRPS